MHLKELEKKVKEWSYVEGYNPDIKKLIVPLGPYRNLTTFTAAIFTLHPQCLALNHAGKRLLNNKTDFF